MVRKAKTLGIIEHPAQVGSLLSAYKIHTRWFIRDALKREWIEEKSIYISCVDGKNGYELCAEVGRERERQTERAYCSCVEVG